MYIPYLHPTNSKGQGIHKFPQVNLMTVSSKGCEKSEGIRQHHMLTIQTYTSPVGDTQF